MAGEKGNNMEVKRNVEEVLESTKAECLRGIEGSKTYGGRQSWYYTHCGEIEMAYNLGLISQERFDELRAEWRDCRPC